jgi:hypothetical protein
MQKTHSALTAVGIALVAGFFLPWIKLTWWDGISGFDMVWHGEGDYLSRLALLCVPLMGAALIAAGVNRSRAAAGMGILSGLGILGYVIVKIAWGLLVTTGIGLWLVLGGAVAAAVVGLGASQPKRP